MINGKNFKQKYGMTSTSITITPLRRSWRARCWPLHLWGGHNEHATDFYTSEVVMTSTPVTFTPPRWSWRARQWSLYLWGGNDEHSGDLYTSEEVITSTLLTYTSEVVMTSTPVTYIPLRWSWRAMWPLHLWGGHDEHLQLWGSHD